MSRNWTHSSLRNGEKLKVPKKILIDNILEGGNPGKLLSMTYIGETSTGIITDLRFQPTYESIEPENVHYRRFISFADIYCGSIQLFKQSDHSQVKVRRAS